jgi:DhnA family fructose-bisphosphate aldolase class Ia
MPSFDARKRQLIVAMDHGRALGAVAGLEDPGQVIDMAIANGADGIMTSFGVVKRWRERLVGRVPVFLRLDGGPSIVKEPWLRNTEWSLLHTLDEADALGVDGVCLMYFMGAPCEMRTLEIVAEVCNECLKDDVPVMVEALPCPSASIPDPLDGRMMADACRIAFEHGADIVKTYYTGSVETFRKVVAGCPAPVLIAGGPKLPDHAAVLQMVADSLAAGGKGVVLGRNIWQHPDPAAMVRALKAVIHDGASAREAAEMLPG